MPKKIQECTLAHVISVPVPNDASVVSHQTIIDYAKEKLAEDGLEISAEEYRCTADGQVAQGIFTLVYDKNPDLSMIFAWTNSYNKQVRFKATVGALVKDTEAIMILENAKGLERKNASSAVADVKNFISSEILTAVSAFSWCCDHASVMKRTEMPKRRQAQMLGILFAEYNILTSEQASLVKNDMNKADYSTAGNLWSFYNFVALALQNSHPKTWMEDQRLLHEFVSSIVDLNEQSEAIDPNQLNILDQIAAVESKVEPQIYIESDEEYAKRVAEIEGEPEAESEFAAEDNFDITPTTEGNWSIEEDAIVNYTDPAGNTFEAPVVTENLQKFSLEPIVEVEEVSAIANLESLENTKGFDFEFGVSEEDDDQDDMPDFF